MVEAGAIETAAAHLVTRVPVAGVNDTVEAVVSRLPGTAYDAANAVYVIDESRAVRGLVPLPMLLTERRDRRLGDIMVRDLPRVRLSDDQERVAHAALRYGVIAVPVVDEQDRLLGVVPPRALMEILFREHSEDLHRLAGIQRERAWARTVVEAPSRREAWHRLPWLLIGLAGSAVATFVMSRFEEVLTGRIAVAFFIPGIVYLADAIGTQTEAITIRELSVTRSSFRSLARHEVVSAVLIGLALALLVFPPIALVYEDVHLAAAVALALLAAATAAGVLGLAIPWLLDHAGLDPAFGSGPAATIVQDVLSLVVYFAMIRLFVA